MKSHLFKGMFQLMHDPAYPDRAKVDLCLFILRTSLAAGTSICSQKNSWSKKDMHLPPQPLPEMPCLDKA